MSALQVPAEPRFIHGLRWVLAIPAAVLGAALAYALVQRVLITLSVRLGLSFELWWVRFGVGFFSLGLASFLLVLIPASLAPSHKDRTALVAAAAVVLGAVGTVVVGLLNGFAGVIVDALVASGVAAAAAAAVHAREGRTV